MACFFPIPAFRSNPTPVFPKGQIFFTEHKIKGAYLPLKIPCGHCVGCRLDKAREWAIRCMHEAKMYEANCFITLTFSDDALQRRKHRFLDKRDFQLFMKRLRKMFGAGIRYYHCGEYGDKFGRPHYHACIFGFDFPDKKLWTVKNGQRLYRSEALEQLWPYGYSSIGAFDFNTAAYVARYTLKKKYGSASKVHYQHVDQTTGEVIEVQSEYSTMSRRPGIGRAWFDQYRGDVFPRDRVLVKGRELRPPRYYDKIFEVEFPSDFHRIKVKRLNRAKQNKVDNTVERLDTRRKVAELNLKQLKRSFET